MAQVLENLSSLTKLRSLFVGKNKIAKIVNLEALTELKLLSIQSNRIIKLENLDQLLNLEELYISHNGLQVSDACLDPICFPSHQAQIYLPPFPRCSRNKLNWY